MSCVENINRYIVPNDIITLLTKLYKYIGKNEIYEDIVKSHINKVVEQTIQRDAFFLGKIINLSLTDTRLRLIITKNSAPRNKEEEILFNLIEILNDIQTNYKKYDYRSNDQLNMINYIYQSQNIKYDFKEEINNISKRNYLDNITDVVINNKNNLEQIILYLNYFIDLHNVKPFTLNNLTASYITLYLLMLKSDLNAFHYVSFFELIYNNLSEFNDRLLDVSYNWKDGIAQPTSFIRFMINLILEGYEKAEKIIFEYKIDQNISKGDNIENTIIKLPSVFTKDQIRAFHPYVSESTINRALQKLRDENKIKPLGKGRSAKWKKNSLSNI